MRTFVWESSRSAPGSRGTAKRIYFLAKVIAMNTATTRVFLSYAREDEAHARRIYNGLSCRGIQVWMDKESLLGGEDFDAAIRKAIQESDYFLVLLSRTATAKRGYINKEIRR